MMLKLELYEPCLLIVGCAKKRKSVFSTCSSATAIQHCLKQIPAPVVFVQQKEEEQENEGVSILGHRRTLTSASAPLPTRPSSFPTLNGQSHGLCRLLTVDQSTSGSQSRFRSSSFINANLALQLKRRFMLFKGSAKS